MSEAENRLEFLERADDEYFRQLKRYKEARFRLGFRGLLTAVALAVGVYFIHVSMPDVGYYFGEGQQPVDLGDVRSKKFDPSILDTLKTNDQVAYRNDVVMFDELSSEEFNFYYSPLTHFVVRTARELPDKELFRLRDSIVELSEWEVGLVTGKRAFPWDLKVSFDGGGRVVRYADAPKWARPVMTFMANSSGDDAQSLFLLLEGDLPEKYAVYLYLIIGAGVLMLATTAFFADALVRWLRARRNVKDPGW
ncbi:MAG: hypothetical protein FJ109_15085 [Deltaproteobacteria bacterium]|nr:hypothetical protein [Deltaproteobacteria bacterium]